MWFSILKAGKRKRRETLDFTNKLGAGMEWRFRAVSMFTNVDRVDLDRVSDRRADLRQRVTHTRVPEVSDVRRLVGVYAGVLDQNLLAPRVRHTVVEAVD